MVTGLGSQEAGAVENLIENVPAGTREIVEALRAVAIAHLTGADEFVYHGALNYKWPGTEGKWVCYIAAQRNYVRLGFYFGGHLPDPSHRLEGTGKRMRHVKIRTVEEAGNPELSELVSQAWIEAAGTS